MNKNFKTFLIIWCVIFVAFSILSCVIPAYNGQPKFSAGFFISYFSVIISLLLILISGYIVFKQDTLKKTFYNISLFVVAYIGLIYMAILCLFTMFIVDFPPRLAMFLSVIIILFTFVSLVLAKASADNSIKHEEKMMVKTKTMNNIVYKVNSLYQDNTNEKNKEILKNLYEEIKYGDMTSIVETEEIEKEIESKICELEEMLKNDAGINIQNIVGEIKIILSKRKQILFVNK